MQEFQRLIDNNRRWAAAAVAENPTYFTDMEKGQRPMFLYIGCSDSRVPAEVATGVGPGELFVHRNVANVVSASDLSAMSVVQYAVEVLDVKHIIIAGHTQCGGVKASMGPQSNGLVDHWLAPVRHVVHRHRAHLDAIEDEQARFDRVVELNVLEQLVNLSESPVIQRAWERGRRPMLHALVWVLREGLLREVATNVGSIADADAVEERLRASAVESGAPTPLAAAV